MYEQERCIFLTDLSLLNEFYEKELDKGRPKKTRNYFLEGRPLVVQASPARRVFQEPICISAPAGRRCCEAAFKFSEFFLKTFNASAHLMMGDL